MKVRACAVCRTDLHVVDGDLPPCRADIVPGHEIIGEVAGLGDGVAGVKAGQRVAWAGSDTPAATAPFARMMRKTSAITLNSPATKETAVSRITW